MHNKSKPRSAKYILVIVLLSLAWPLSTHAQQPGCLPPPSGLVSWLPGDGNTDDIVGNNNGTLHGGAAYCTGEVCQGFSLDGGTGYVSVGNPPNLKFNSLTIDAWIKPTRDTGDLLAIVTKWNQSCSGGPDGDSYGLWLTHDNGALVVFADVHRLFECNFYTQGGIVPLNTFSHVAMTYDAASGVLNVYLNGSLTGSIVGGPRNLVQSDVPIEIGHEHSGGRYFPGMIDEVEIFNRALDPSEIAAIYIAGSLGKCKATACPSPAPPTIAVKDAAGNSVPCNGVKSVSNDGQCGTVAVPLTVTATPDAACCGEVTVNVIRSDGHQLSDPFPVGSTVVNVTATDACGQSSGCAFTVSVTNDRTISSNFNGTAIPGNSYIWFNAVLKPSGLNATSGPVTIKFINQKITSSKFSVSVPDSTVIFDPNATCVSATFANGQWIVTAPKSGASGNTFLSGVPFQVSAAGLPSGINPVNWSGTFITDTSAVNVNWAWAAAVYTNFNPNPAVIGVKATDDNHHDCTTQNSDHAGTPEQFKPNLIGGGRGGGGSNYTGSLSGTQSVAPCDTF